jgi:hypothetical protein
VADTPLLNLGRRLSGAAPAPARGGSGTPLLSLGRSLAGGDDQAGLEAQTQRVIEGLGQPRAFADDPDLAFRQGAYESGLSAERAARQRAIEDERAFGVAAEQAAEQAGPLGRLGANVAAGFGQATQQAQDTWNAILPHLSADRSPLANTPVLEGMAPGLTPEMAAVGGEAGALSRIGGQLAGGLAGSVVDPVTAPLMAVTPAVSARVMGSQVVQRVLGAIGQKAGPKAATAAARILEASDAVGALEAVDAGSRYPNWLEDPGGGLLEMTKAAGLGVAAGAALGAPAAAAGLVAPTDTARRGRRQGPGDGTADALPADGALPPAPVPSTVAAASEAAPRAAEQPRQPVAEPVQPQDGVQQDPLAGAGRGHGADDTADRLAAQVALRAQVEAARSAAGPRTLTQPAEVVPTLGRGDQESPDRLPAPAGERRPPDVEGVPDARRGERGAQGDRGGQAVRIDPAPARKPKRGEFSKADIERRLTNFYDDLGFDRGNELEGSEADVAGTDTISTSFVGNVPEDVRQAIEGKPAGFRMKFRPNQPRGRGEDSIAALGMDEYIRRLEVLSRPHVSRAVDLARKMAPERPDAAFLVFLHENLPKRQKNRRPYTVIDAPSTALPDGATLRVAGKPFAVVRDDDGFSYLVEQQAIDPDAEGAIDAFPDPMTVPLDAIDTLPIDAGTLSLTGEPLAEIDAAAAVSESEAAAGSARPAKPAREDPPAAAESPPDPEPPTTSARQAQMDEDRAALGLDTLNSPERRTWEAALQGARDEGIPDRALRIAAEVNAEPRALSDVETAGLVVHAAKLKNEHKAAMRRVAEAKDPADVAAASAEANRIQDEFDALSTALRTSGTEKGRALAAQKLTIDQDLSLVAMKAQAKAATGRALTAAESAKIEALSKQMDEQAAQIAELERKLADQVAQRALQHARTRTRSKKRTKGDLDAEFDTLIAQTKALLKAGCKDT